MNKIQRRIVLDALDEEWKLSERDSEFINSLADRDEQQPDLVLSEAQNKWLNDINQRLQTRS